MRYVFILFFSLVIFSCNNVIKKSNQYLSYTVIDVGSNVGKGRVVDLSEIAYDITYIPLESNSDSFIGRSPVVIFENERIYIKSSGVIKVFDSRGKYIFTFDRKGRGPHEYFWDRPRVEKGTGKFYVAEFKGGNIVLKIYSRDGDFQNEIVMSFVQNRFVAIDKTSANCYSFKLYNHSEIPGVMEQDNEFSRILVDSLSNVIGYIPKLPTDSRLVLDENRAELIPKGIKLINPLGNSIPQALHFFKDSIRVYDFFGDTIYSFEDSSSLHPRYVMDYGKYASSKIFLNQTTDYSGKLITIDHNFYYETDNFLLLSFLLRDYAHEPFYGKKSYLHLKDQEIRDSYGYFNKITNKFTFLNQPLKGMQGFRDDIHHGPPFVPTYLSGDKYMLTVYYPHTLMDYACNNKVSGQLQKIIDGLAENDNIVVALVKLK